MGADAATKTAKDPDTAAQAGQLTPVPVSVLVFSTLTLFVEAAAQHLGMRFPGVDQPRQAESVCDPSEARAAIDAANALLAAARGRLSTDERQAIETLLTQLQVEYVRRAT